MQSPIPPPTTGSGVLPLDTGEQRLAAKRELNERHLRVLRRLGEIEMDLVERAYREVIAEDAAESAAEPADKPRTPGRDPRLVVSSLARSLRQTLAMEAKVTEEEHDRAGFVEYTREQQAKRAEQEETARREAWYADRRSTAIDLVTPLIEAEAEDERNEADLYRWLDELVDDEDIDNGFAVWPIGEITARFCRKLELTPDWDAWRNEPWAIEEASSNTPGSPYADSTGPP